MVNLEVLDGITAHSTRSATTSTALHNRASVEEICKAAIWSSISTFIRHYKLNTFASANATLEEGFYSRWLQGMATTYPGFDHCFGSSVRYLPTSLRGEGHLALMCHHPSSRQSVLIILGRKYCLEVSTQLSCYVLSSVLLLLFFIFYSVVFSLLLGVTFTEDSGVMS